MEQKLKDLEKLVPGLLDNIEHLASVPPRAQIRLYRDLRDLKAALNNEVKPRIDLTKTLMERIEGFMLDRLHKDEADSMKTPDGTAYTKIRRAANVSDWSAFSSWAIENGHTRMFQKKPISSEVLGYMDETGEDVPGVTIYEEEVLNIKA